MIRPSVSPAPPRARGGVPYLRSTVSFLRAPTAFLEAERARLGDTFLLDAMGLRMLFLFSPEGLRSLYALPEEDASFTEATRSLLGLKLPPELIQGDMAMFSRLFGRDRRETYLGHVEDACERALDALPPSGELELFEHAKGLVHRVGFRSWAGPEAISPRYFERLVRLFEALDPEQAFLRPGTALVTIATRHAPERRALAEVRAILGEILAARAREGRTEGDMIEELRALHAGAPDALDRVARDVMILHLASLSNLYAAIGWTFVHLLREPSYRARLDEDAFVDALAEEAIRWAQRSITLRKVSRPLRLDDGRRTLDVAPGVYVATMLSVTNRSAAPPLASFDPAHYARGALTVPLRSKEEVSTFGHGAHSCPGRRFALAAIRIAVRAHLRRLELTPTFDASAAAPRAEQIGAVARTADPCRVRYVVR